VSRPNDFEMSVA